MRLLVYGMQSSGASTFTRVLAERPNCIALINILNNFAAPRVVTTVDFVAKALITTAYSLPEHVERFRPDRVVLLVRDPRDNYESLRTKYYCNHSGLIDEKFLLLDQIFAAQVQFDAVVAYEDFIARDPVVFATMAKLGWPISEEQYCFRRSNEELTNTLLYQEPVLRESMEVTFGNVSGQEVSRKVSKKAHRPEIEAHLEKLCPRLLGHYRARHSAANVLDVVPA